MVEREQIKALIEAKRTGDKAAEEQALAAFAPMRAEVRARIASAAERVTNDNA